MAALRRFLPFLLYGILLVVSFYPQSLSPWNTIAYIGDSLEAVWVLSWNAHQLCEDPVHILNANILHPNPHALTYTDHRIGTGLLVTPVLWLSGNPVLASTRSRTRRKSGPGSTLAQPGHKKRPDASTNTAVDRPRMTFIRASRDQRSCVIASCRDLVRCRMSLMIYAHRSHDLCRPPETHEERWDHNHVEDRRGEEAEQNHDGHRREDFGARLASA